MPSATFLVESPGSDDRLLSVMSAVGQLHSSGLLKDFTLKGATGSDLPGKLYVEGTPEGLAEVAVVLQAEPLLTADLICAWCLEREASEVIGDSEAAPSIRAAICEVCLEQGLSARLLRWKQLVASG